QVFKDRYHWDDTAARLEELPVPAAAAVSALLSNAPNPLTGLRLRHTILVDPGHGGADPGNPGLYFPDGLVEKDITLNVAKLLRAELIRRGLDARLTRTRDTLIDLADRGGFCSGDCDLFVSIHVNSMPRGQHQSAASGVETYFLSDAKTEDQRRVAQMENDAIRFETEASNVSSGDLGFILRDLQANEYLRESARLAQLVQQRVSLVHPGGDRGVQQAGFMVLTTARRPAILVETGFATNRTDAAFLASSLGQHKVASAIADGIVAYLLEFERKLSGMTAAGRAPQ
ncbi:MAG TPA: N-acetylmuramoyl-L-alanine amidase, partial [Gemmatimonadales bacterium]|nr:N-acetylmuramoyl-L-alanine amidase [Gemmatimonadales bacterium]